MPTTIIPLSRNKLLTLLVLTLVFMTIGGFFVYMAITEKTDEIILLWIVGLVLVSFFGWAAYAIVQKYRDPRPGLIISDEGITENTNSMSVGLVPWEDIKDMELYNMLGREFLVILVNNPREYIAKARTPAQKKFMKTNLKMFGSPIGISANPLAKSFDEVVELVENRWMIEKKRLGREE